MNVVHFHDALTCGWRLKRFAFALARLLQWIDWRQTVNALQLTRSFFAGRSHAKASIDQTLVLETSLTFLQAPEIYYYVVHLIYYY